MNISRIVERIRELKLVETKFGIEGYFDGLNEDEIIDLALFRWEMYIESHVDEIKKAMEIDSESVEKDGKVHEAPTTDLSGQGDDEYDVDWCDDMGDV